MIQSINQSILLGTQVSKVASETFPTNKLPGQARHLRFKPMGLLTKYYATLKKNKKQKTSYIKRAAPTRPTIMPAMPARDWGAEPSKSSSSSGYGGTPWAGRPLGLVMDGTKGGVPAG